jgi:hypothetical protein
MMRTSRLSATARVTFALDMGARTALTQDARRFNWCSSPDGRWIAPQTPGSA